MQRSSETHSRFDTARRGQLHALRISLSIVAVAASLAAMSLAGTSLPAAAQVATVTPTPAPAATASPDAIKQREQELEATRAQQKSAAEAQEKLKADIAAIGQDRAKFNQQLIDIAAQVRGVETKIGDAEARLRPLDDREQQIRGSLDSRRSEIIEVLAALQRAGRRTPPALLVRPEDALQSLRTAMLLGSVVPELRASRAEARRRSRRTGCASQDHRHRARPACRRPRQTQGRSDPARGADRRTAAPAELDRERHGG